MPALPWQRVEEFVSTHGLPAYDAEILIQDPEVVQFFESCVEKYPHPKKVSNWVINDLRQEMNERQASVQDIQDIGLSPDRLVDLLQAVDNKQVSVQNGREVFKKLMGNSRSVAEIIKEMGFEMISDDSVIQDAVEEAIKANPSVVEDLRSGKKNAKNFLVGKVMQATRGKANPGQVAQLISKMVEGG